MATLYGGAMPDDFVSGEELTATEFNKVKNYWIVDGDLPEGPEINDGDVVFVLGDETVGAAEITAITGSGVTHTYDDCVAFEFLTSGTMTSTGGIIEEALVIGGGASGGASGSGAGGGGAGGHLELTNLYLPDGTASIVVGDGADAITHGGGNNTSHGQNGVPSSVGGIYFSPGGGGGATNTFTYNTTPSYSNGGGNGGSGGGAAYAASGGVLTGGLGVSGLGYAGGDSNSSGHGAGGGAGAAGGNGVVAPGATGGAGKSSSITGTAVTRAGGGGAYNAGVGGSGGGGNAGNPAGAGDSNTGSGGGAGSVTSGAGGSGVVIIKVLAVNAASVDKSGWTEVTALMLAEAEVKRNLERKKLEATRVLEEKKLDLEAKNEELSGATQMDIEGDLI